MRATELALDTEIAKAKVNLSLHVTGRRPDGYHMLDSLVVFPELGDVLAVEGARTLSLTLDGPYALDLSADADNLVLRAAEMLGAGQGAALHLTKTLPVASGIGGGSADAAAALRLLARHWRVEMPAPATLARLGADVPVCLKSTSQRMRGIGEDLSDLPPLPPFWLVLANPNQPVPTGAVFDGLETVHNAPCAVPDRIACFDDLVETLRGQRNDLEAPARQVCPIIGEVLAALADQPLCALARMSGSGATCFGLFERENAALAAADALRVARPGWWVAAGPVS
ncbi:MAG: 4-(cytidine 5'-diphospho)-2-C-methyl-D-erythritol kinase, partial [Pseudomonadota bacterium]